MQVCNEALIPRGQSATTISISKMPHGESSGRLWLIPFPNAFTNFSRWLLRKNPHFSRTIASYASGVFFALAWAVFLDALILSGTAKAPIDSPGDPLPVHMTFTDWVPGILALLGMIIVCSLNKEHLQESIAYGSEDDSFAWRIKAVLFIGFSLLAGGLAGSVVRHFGCYSSTYISA